MSSQNFFNPFIEMLLHSPLHGLLSASAALITITGRRSGNTITLPVNYVRDGAALLIVTKSSRTWWRNLRNPAELTVRVGGVDHQATGRAITDPEQVRQALCVMLRNQAALRRYYEVSVQADGTLTDSLKLNQALSDLVIVQIDELHA